LFYALLARRNHIRDLATDASHGTKKLDTEVLAAFPILVPKLEVQRRIVDIIAVYDDLIENNRGRMALLAEAARQLYREWFVHLRFPGHEHTRVKNGVPEGWQSKSLDELCQVGRGSSPRPIQHYMDGAIPWFKIADATASESVFIFHTKELVTEDGSKKSVFVEPGDFILSNSATCGVPYFAGVSGCIHDGWLHFSDYNRITPRFLYCYFYFKRDELVSSVSDGSTQKNLNTAAVGRVKLLLPEHDTLLNQFDDTTAPLFAQVFNLGRQNIALRAARDLLLPRLMSGELAV
jgi:type I restriction enzyme S subunit